MTDEEIARRWCVREAPSPEVIARLANNLAALRRL